MIYIFDSTFSSIIDQKLVNLKYVLRLLDAVSHKRKVLTYNFIYILSAVGFF